MKLRETTVNYTYLVYAFISSMFSNQAKKEAKKTREKEGIPKKTPHTIDSLREKDETTITDLNAEENELIRDDLEQDEFSDYFKQSYDPKVLITYSDNPMKVQYFLFSIQFKLSK